MNKEKLNKLTAKKIEMLKSAFLLEKEYYPYLLKIFDLRSVSELEYFLTLESSVLYDKLQNTIGDEYFTIVLAALRLLNGLALDKKKIKNILSFSTPIGKNLFKENNKEIICFYQHDLEMSHRIVKFISLHPEVYFSHRLHESVIKKYYNAGDNFMNERLSVYLNSNSIILHLLAELHHKVKHRPLRELYAPKMDKV